MDPSFDQGVSVMLTPSITIVKSSALVYLFSFNYGGAIHLLQTKW
ncbi:hypothetical protein [Metallosphaera hakonensis]|nr:hypothetical protein [Metallosphaera hakonensis]